MCSHYEDASDINRLLAAIGLSYGEPEPYDPGVEYDYHPTLYAKPTAKTKGDMWPRYPGRFIRRHLNADVGDEAVPELEVVSGPLGAHLSAYQAREHCDRKEAFHLQCAHRQDPIELHLPQRLVKGADLHHPCDCVL